ncbi:hypothetical protein GBA52_028961 [Prunus armeniaca]|nr:hypothetical protein GBA52_028961 [Prunus armeniaca]
MSLCISRNSNPLLLAPSPNDSLTYCFSVGPICFSQLWSPRRIHSAMVLLSDGFQFSDYKWMTLSYISSGRIFHQRYLKANIQEHSPFARNHLIPNGCGGMGQAPRKACGAGHRTVCTYLSSGNSSHIRM